MLKINLNSFQGKRLHVIDASSVMMATHANTYLPNLSYVVDGQEFVTKALYGLMKVFKSLPLSDDFIFCFDEKGNKRKEENEGYKAGRAKQEEEYFIQYALSKEILSKAGFGVVSEVGLEADDFVVESVNKFKGLYDTVFVHSNDYDLGQCVDSNVVFKNVVQSRTDITVDNYEEALKCPFNSILLYKATKGDSSDKMLGIRGFGQAAFDRFIQSVSFDYATENIRNNELEREIIKDTVGLTDDQREQAMNALNIVLPRKPDGEIEAGRLTDINSFLAYMHKYGMNSVIKEIEKIA